MRKQQHAIDVTAGAVRRERRFTKAPECFAEAREIGARVRATRVRLNIMSALATGFLPWGVDWRHDGRACITLQQRGQYVLCCGHVLGKKVAQEFVTAGLLMDGGDDRGAPCLVITEAGREWLKVNWR